MTSLDLLAKANIGRGVSDSCTKPVAPLTKRGKNLPEGRAKGGFKLARPTTIPRFLAGLVEFDDTLLSTNYEISWPLRDFVSLAADAQLLHPDAKCVGEESHDLGRSARAFEPL